jgi:hypothetical protein
MQAVLQAMIIADKNLRAECQKLGMPRPSRQLGEGSSSYVRSGQKWTLVAQGRVLKAVG